MLKKDDKIYGEREEFMIGLGTLTTIIDNKRYRLDGFFSISALKKSIKFPPEIQLQIFSKEPFKLEGRGVNNGVWNRGEIYFNVENIDRVIDAILKAKEYLKPEDKDAKL